MLFKSPNARRSVKIDGFVSKFKFLAHFRHIPSPDIILIHTCDELCVNIKVVGLGVGLVEIVSVHVSMHMRTVDIRVEPVVTMTSRLVKRPNPGVVATEEYHTAVVPRNPPLLAPRYERTGAPCRMLSRTQPQCQSQRTAVDSYSQRPVPSLSPPPVPTRARTD